jgi:hypothetical protein
MTHHPHVHTIVPGGDILLDGMRWVSCRPCFFLPVPVLSKLFRRLFLAKLADAHAAERLKLFGNHAGLSERSAFAAFLAPLRNRRVIVGLDDLVAGRTGAMASRCRRSQSLSVPTLVADEVRR